MLLCGNHAMLMFATTSQGGGAYLIYISIFITGYILITPYEADSSSSDQRYDDQVTPNSRKERSITIRLHLICKSLQSEQKEHNLWNWRN